jgi:inhibitor of cysteine peptidase
LEINNQFKGGNKMNKKILWLGLAAISIIIFITGCLPIMPAIGLATVEEIDILTLESFPVQIFVIASGYLPDPCTEIYQINQEREGNAFFITIKTYRSPGFCIQVLAPFEEVIPLYVYGLPAGTYTVEVNGVQGTFDLEIDNILSL